LIAIVRLQRFYYGPTHKIPDSPVPYFHVVLTLPPLAAEIAFQNKALVYALLMRAAAEALMTLAGDPKHLGAEIGLLTVLHTWGQTLTHRPHVHCVVPGGGLSLDGKRWIACRPNFFLPVHALSRLFRRLFLAGLEAAFRNGDLRFFGALAPLKDKRAFVDRIKALRQNEWVVYAKPPFGGPAQVPVYLARYTHRAAITNSRLVAVTACPDCGGLMRRIGHLSPTMSRPFRCDTS
jgi:Putative transposase